MKTYYYYLFLIFVVFFSACGHNRFKINSSIEMNIPILHVKDSTFKSLLNSLTSYKDSCKFYNKSRADNFFWFSPFIDENRDTLLEIETEEDINTYLFFYEYITLQGIIPMGDCYFLFFDTLGIFDKYLEPSKRTIKFQYIDDDEIVLREFDSWIFSLDNNQIILQDFYPYDETVKYKYKEFYNTPKN